MKKRTSITQWIHEILSLHLPKEGLYVDATMGNGHDTLFLCRLAGEKGQVYAFDIQQAALDHTRNLLEQEGVFHGFSLILDNHAHMGEYLAPESTDAILFNCGYLPGGDHHLATRPETTIQAIDAGLPLLKSDGVLSLCLYSGGDAGLEEKDAVLQYLKELDPRRYTVIVQQYYNHPHNPPTPVLVIKK